VEFGAGRTFEVGELDHSHRRIVDPDIRETAAIDPDAEGRPGESPLGGPVGPDR
jgi:hypothetical protein